jgi:two-component system NarL family sensor kinase
MEYKKVILLFVIICSLIFVFLTTSIVLVVFKYQKKRRVHKINILDLKSEHENEILKSQIKVQEQTFQHIANEIHDNIGQKLSFAKLQLNVMQDFYNKHQQEIIQEIANVITESLSDLRNLSRSLSLDFIANNGFIKAVENEIEKLNKSGLYQFKLIVQGDSQFLDLDKELMLFRIVQESLNNVVKHAQAKQILIKLHYTANSLLVNIEDDGIGFDVNKKSNGSGLSNISKRAQSIGGFATINSSESTGTIVQINIPIYEPKKV